MSVGVRAAPDSEFSGGLYLVPRKTPTLRMGMSSEETEVDGLKCRTEMVSQNESGMGPSWPGATEPGLCVGTVGEGAELVLVGGARLGALWVWLARAESRDMLVFLDTSRIESRAMTRLDKEV